MSIKQDERFTNAYITIASMMVVIYYCLLFLFKFHGFGLLVLSDSMAVLISFTATVCVIHNIKQSIGKEKYFWKFMMIAYSSYTLAEFFWFYKEVVLGVEVPFPSICDVFYLAHPIFVFIGMIFLVTKASLKGSTFQLLINIGIGISVLFVFSWDYIIYPALVMTDLSLLGVILSIAYPIGDLMIVLGVLLICLIQDTFVLKMPLLGGGFILMAAVDTIYMYQTNAGTYVTGGFLDPLWSAALLMSVFAGLKLNLSGIVGDGFKRKYGWFPEKLKGVTDTLVPSGALILMIVVMNHDNKSSVVMVGYIVATVLLIIRHQLSVTANKNLSTALSENVESLKKNESTQETRIERLKSLHTQTKNQASKDHLTQMFNRRHIDEMLAHMSSCSANGGNLFSILMVDIDHFKEVNDRYGHAIGDYALKTISAMIQEYVRGDEMVGRYGGDEFIVFLPGTGKQHARLIAERIRSNIEDREIIFDGGILRCTLSIGVAEWEFSNCCVEGVLKNADEALYQAKTNGRNQVAVYLNPSKF